jgi:hypothetical protein
MIVMETNAFKTHATAHTIYRCRTCDNVIEVVDDMDMTKQRCRELELLLTEAIDKIEDQDE